MTIADRPIYQLSIDALRQAAVNGRGLAPIGHALESVGALAVTGLSSEYANALKRMTIEAPSCIGSEAEALEVRLMDGTMRRSVVRSNSEASHGDFPRCVASDVRRVLAAFDEVEKVLISVLGRLLGNNSSLEVRENDRPLSLLELTTKTHLHVYKGATTESSNARNPKLSLPYHVDSGLYLLLTPAAGSQQLLLRSKTGRNIRTGHVDPNSLIFLLGRGLTDWLLQGADQLMLTPARHAVPSLAGAKNPRTVLARMRVAPLAAVAGTRAFGEVFLDGRVAPSAASLCYYGGPFTREEARLRARREAAACWPHTEKC